MSITTTTPSVLVPLLIAQIEGITPTHTEYSEREWTHSEDHETTTADVRTFDFIAHPEVPTEEGIHGDDGLGYEFDVQVVVSYGGIAPADARRIVGADGADLRRVFELAYSTISVSGDQAALPVPDIYDVEYGLDGVDGDDESTGTLFAIFRFLVRYKQAD